MKLIGKLREISEKRELAASQKRYGAALTLWEQGEGALRSMIDFVESFDDLDQSELGDISFSRKKGERVLLIGSGAALIEPRRTPGHYAGAHSGVSFRVMKGVRLYSGSSRGTYVQGPEVPTTIDTGTFVITDQRLVFMGQKQSREWAFSKLLGVEHHTDQPWTSIAVSNRQKTSGVLYDNENAEMIRFRLSYALALSNDEGSEFQTALRRELQEHLEARPAVAPHS